MGLFAAISLMTLLVSAQAYFGGAPGGYGPASNPLMMAALLGNDGSSSNDLLPLLLMGKGGYGGGFGMNPLLLKKLMCTEVNDGDCIVPNSSTGKTCGRSAVATSDSSSNVKLCCRCKTTD